MTITYLFCYFLNKYFFNGLFQERTYKTYQSIEFFPQKFTQYLLSPEVGFNKCEVVSIPAHPSKGFQRPIQLFTKAGTSPDTSNAWCTTAHRFVSREQKKRDYERRVFERDLFPHELPKLGNLSDLSQRSGESLSQYEQLENIYAPSTTPCYDTPSHNADSQPFEPEKMCYVDVKADPSKQETPSTSKLLESRIKEKIETEQQQQTIESSNNLQQRKRKAYDTPLPAIKLCNGERESAESTELKRPCIVVHEPIDEDTEKNKTNQPNSEESTTTDITPQKENSPADHQRDDISALSEHNVQVSARNLESNSEKT